MLHMAHTLELVELVAKNPCILAAQTFEPVNWSPRCAELEEQLASLRADKKDLEGAAEKQEIQYNLVVARLQRKTFQLQQVSAIPL